MVDRQQAAINLPPSERPLDYKDFSYSLVTSKLELSKEITVSITFTLGRRIPASYLGHSYMVLNGNAKALEAKSFLDAAKSAWERHGKSESYGDFVKKKLEEKWEELDGEKLTGEKLKFDTET